METYLNYTYNDFTYLLVLKTVEKERQKIGKSVEEMVSVYSHLVRSKKNNLDMATPIPSWVYIPPRPDKKLERKSKDSNNITMEEKDATLKNMEYDELFQKIRFGRILKWVCIYNSNTL